MYCPSLSSSESKNFGWGEAVEKTVLCRIMLIKFLWCYSWREHKFQEREEKFCFLKDKVLSSTEWMLLKEIYKASLYRRLGSGKNIGKTKWKTQVAPAGPAGGPDAVWESGTRVHGFASLWSPAPSLENNCCLNSQIPQVIIGGLTISLWLCMASSLRVSGTPLGEVRYV